MNINELYKHWLANSYWSYKLPEGTRPEDIVSLHFYSHIGGGSPYLHDDNFSTFAGCELWQAEVRLVNNAYVKINFYDFNPVSEIVYYAKQNNITIEFDKEEEPKLEDMVDAHLRKS